MTPEEKAAADKAAQEHKEKLAKGGEFAALVGDLDKLQKGLPPAMSGSSQSEAEESSEEEEAPPARGGKMGKSFKVKLEGGEEMDAVDGTEMLKSMGKRLARTVKTQEAANNLLKALAPAVATAADTQATLLKALTTQTENVTKLTGEVAELKKSIDSIANKGQGRKSATVILHDKGADGKEQGVEPRQFLAKALELQGQGRLSGHAVSVAEACINTGREIPVETLRIVGAALTK